MIKQDLIQLVCREYGLSQALSKRIVDTFFGGLTEAISKGDRIEIRGFGSWDVRESRANHNARNPMTGERVSVPARRKVLFKPGKRLKEALSGGGTKQLERLPPA